ncbi:MAG: hypothetical protein M3173_07545, partial [Chloroflexota bacterium]|nr:hypothetical protein [Chloroflexota bacterium]
MGARPRMDASGIAPAVGSSAMWNGNLFRALIAYATLQRSFYLESPKLYREHYPYTGGNTYSYLWPFSHALAASAHLAEHPKTAARYDREISDRLDGLEAYWNSSLDPPAYDSYVRPPLGYGGDRYYDDNVWIGLDLLRVYRLTGDTAALN